jgi:hypothetical protein
MTLKYVSKHILLHKNATRDWERQIFYPVRNLSKCRTKFHNSVHCLFYSMRYLCISITIITCLVANLAIALENILFISVGGWEPG